jgi:hypothetical protein
MSVVTFTVRPGLGASAKSRLSDAMSYQRREALTGMRAGLAWQPRAKSPEATAHA